MRGESEDEQVKIEDGEEITYQPGAKW